MEFARFAVTYNQALAVFGAAFCLLVAPFFGVYWGHWLTGCIFQVLVAVVLSAMRPGPDDFAIGVHDTRHLLAVLIVPLLALATISFLPLAHWPMAAWLIPGVALTVGNLILLFAAVVDDYDAEVHVTELTSNYGGHCYVPHCNEWSRYAVDVSDAEHSEVRFELCFGHNREFKSKRDDFELCTYESIVLWMRRCTRGDVTHDRGELGHHQCNDDTFARDWTPDTAKSPRHQPATQFIVQRTDNDRAYPSARESVISGQARREV